MSYSSPISAVKEDHVNLLEVIAAAAHNANRAYCLGIGDTSQPLWSAAPEWQRRSAILGVEGALKGNTPEQSHESWLKHKRGEGWVHGPVKDPAKKEHPCMVPYAELPAEQKLKDEIYLATVRDIAALVGYQV